MITIPIWLFVILVTFSTILTLIVGIYIISYIKYCRYQDEKTKKIIGEKYGTREEK